MRLRRIQAVRFGNIDGLSLGDLSPRLTVVHGPNEAGKSSLTALVRYVLYGFPTPAAVSEPPYLSSSGPREGRLVFGDGDREWVVDRVEGPKGGRAEVRALDGAAREGLLPDLIAGVSKGAYRLVYGFGLADLQQIEELKGKDDDLFQQLYAASAGLGARLSEARTGIDGAMEGLWKKGGSVSDLNRAKAERERVRAEIRALEAEAESLRADALRLEAAAPLLDAARARRTETQGRAEQVSRAAAEAERLLAEAATAEREAERLERDAASARAAADGARADAALVAGAATVDALAEELSGYREQSTALASQESRLGMLEARLRAAVADTGWTEERALAAASDAGAGAEIEAARDRLSKAQARLDLAVSARDAARAGAAGDAAGAGAPSRPWLVPGAVVATIGLAGAVAGLYLGQTLLAAFAGALVAVGVGLAVVVRGGAAPAGGAAQSRIATVEAELAAATDALEAARGSWGDWVRARGFGDGSEDPAAVSARYQAARAVREAEGERSDVATALVPGRASVEGYARRVREAIAPLLGEEPRSVTPDRVPELVNRGRALVAETRESAKVESEARARAAGLDAEAAESRVAATESLAGASGALEAGGAPGGTIEDVRGIEVEARVAASDAADEFDLLSTEIAQLRVRIGAEGRDTALATLRLTEESLDERIAAGVRDYAVLALASRLLAQTQARYERDRQPEVVKRAEAAFALMTEGRYTRISVPLGKDAIEVFDASARAVSPGHLSRGTAEQLYLALRIGLIEQGGDVGADLPVLMDDVLVDFSPKRAEQAARAIADLATRRQVVFFTCHPATADLLCGVARGSVRLELEGPR